MNGYLMKFMKKSFLIGFLFSGMLSASNEDLGLKPAITDSSDDDAECTVSDDEHVSSYYVRLAHDNEVLVSEKRNYERMLKNFNLLTSNIKKEIDRGQTEIGKVNSKNEALKKRLLIY